MATVEIAGSALLAVLLIIAARRLVRRRARAFLSWGYDESGAAGERPASKTAVGVAMLRAAHQLLDDEPKVLNDTVIVRLLGQHMVKRLLASAPRFREPRSLALRSHVLLRSRFTEDRLRGAVDRGAAQLVVLGAGLDTFAFRQPAWASAVRIYEVDHPASQSVKQRRLADENIAVPPNVTFVPVDFEHDTLQNGLARAGFDPAVKTFVSCLGVLVYLTAEAIDGVFAFVASLPPGSECAFTFGGAARPDTPGNPSLATVVAHLGEPFQSPLELDDVRTVLARATLGEPVLLTAGGAGAYLGDRRDGLRPPKHERIASVVVGTHQGMASTS